MQTLTLTVTEIYESINMLIFQFYDCEWGKPNLTSWFRGRVRAESSLVRLSSTTATPSLRTHLHSLTLCQLVHKFILRYIPNPPPFPRKEEPSLQLFLSIKGMFQNSHYLTPHPSVIFQALVGEGDFILVIFFSNHWLRVLSLSLLVYFIYCCCLPF